MQSGRWRGIALGLNTDKDDVIADVFCRASYMGGIPDRHIQWTCGRLVKGELMKTDACRSDGTYQRDAN